MHRNALLSKWKGARGVAMQLPLHYWKCTRAKEYRVILAIQSLRRTINGNWLWSGQSWKFRATRGYSQADWATSDRRGLRQTGSLKLKLCLILANNCEIWCRPMPSAVYQYLFRFMISMLRPKSTSRPNVCFRQAFRGGGDQLILCPDFCLPTC